MVLFVITGGDYVDLFSLGNKIYEIRTSKGLSQDVVSNAIGISQPTYSNFENGKYDITYTQLNKLCKYFGVSITYLLDTGNNHRFTNAELLKIEEFKRYIISIRK